MSTRSDRRAALAALVVATAALQTGPASADEPAPSSSETDALDSLRKRFDAGRDRYNAGAYAEAIVIFEAVYRELGAEKGYRLAYNLARAYEQFGDSTRAAENFEAYVKEVTRRVEAGETLEAVVLKQESEARDRLAALAATHARIRIASERPIVVKIDGGTERLAPFVAYVAPGRHVVTFNPGSATEARTETAVDVGTVVEIEAPRPKVEPPRPSIRFTTVHERPYGKTVLYVAAGVTVASFVVPLLFHAKAEGLYDDGLDARSASTIDPALLPRYAGLKADYESARSTYYASFALPAVFAAATIALTAYWFYGVKETRVPVTASVLPGGAALGVSTRF